MNELSGRRRLGRILQASGIVLALIGVVGAVADNGFSGDDQVIDAAPPVETGPPGPDEEPTILGPPPDGPVQPSEVEPSASPTDVEPTETETEFDEVNDSADPIPFGGRRVDPEADVYACQPDGVDGASPRTDILSVTTNPDATNPVTGESSSSFTIVMADVFDGADTGAQAIVLVDAKDPIRRQPGPDDLRGDQLQMTFVGGDPPFAKTRRTWDGSAWQEADASEFNARFDSTGDEVVFEFFGPPGTDFYAALVTDTRSCDLVIPSA